MAVSTKYGKVDIPKIGVDEPVFILRAQDKLAEAAIEMYRLLAASHSSKLVDSLDRETEAFRNWQGVKKLPDGPVVFTSATEMPQEVHLPELDRITIDEVKQRMDKGESLLFIDTRNLRDWGESDVKLPGAVRIHFNELEQHLEELPHDRTIVTYCTGNHEESSARAAQILLDHSFQNVYPMQGGFDAWRQAGYPLESKFQGSGFH